VILRRRLLRRTLVAATTALTLVALLPTSAAGGREATEVLWKAPTPAEGKVYKVAAGSSVSFTLSAGLPATPAPVTVPVEIAAASTLPAGAKLTVRPGASATARFTWSPTIKQAGVHRIGFVASAAGLANAPLRSVTIRVVGIQQALLSDPSTEIYRWAFVKRRTAVRSAPSSRARSVGTIATVTPEYFPNLVQTLNVLRYPNGQTWVRVRIASLPNSKTGWVRRGKLGRYRTVNTRLVVSLGGLRATLYRRGRPVLRTVIGVGQSRWPTPRGDFYVREILTGYNMPAYGPVAFGLSARSNVLTDWPGGGFIGIHGTNAPGILPGRVSHGCIRMRNSAVLRLKRLMPLGTPVQVR
jgi:lipoprotein-anchoring transpeptidase ErfK/SrfK